VPSSDYQGFSNLLETVKSKFPFVFEIIDESKKMAGQSVSDNRLNLELHGVNLVPYSVLDQQINTFIGSFSIIGLVKLMIRIGLWIWFFGWVVNQFRPKMETS